MSARERPMTDDKLVMRPPPHFAIFASDDLASSRYFGLSSGERGLLASMERAYWAEGGRPLPQTPVLLARVTRLDTAEVERFLTPLVMVHFEADETDSGVLHHIELRRQLRNIRAQREKMSAGGQKGAEVTNSKRDGRRKPKPS